MELLFLLLTLLLTTRAFGEVAVRLGQPALVGELLSGIALGTIAITIEPFPSIAEQVRDDPVHIALTDLGIFFLMLMGGIELRSERIIRASGTSAIVASCGLLLPVAVGFALAWLFLPSSQYLFAQCLLVGTALAITAVPVSIRVLMDLNKLESPPGEMIVSAAIVDDVLSLILLAVLTGILRTGGLPAAPGLLPLAGKIVLFFGVMYVIGRYVFPRLGRWITGLKSAEAEFTVLLLIALAFAVFAELLALHFIVGAFLAGLFFEREVAGEATYEDLKSKVSGITAGFLAPIFFASIGMHLQLQAVTAIPLFLALLIVAAFLSKLVGAGVPAYLLGLSRRDAAAVGMGMSARGAVELIIADIALRAGLFSHPDPPPPEVANLFSAIVIVAIVTTLATPIGLNRVFAAGNGDRGQ